MAYSLDVTVLGGLPITVEFKMAGADRDVGIMSAYVDDWWITAIGDRPCKKSPDWLYKRIEAKPGELDKLLEKLAEFGDDMARGEQDYRDDPEY